MDWIQTLKDLWWLVASVLILFGYLWKTAVRANKSKERLEQVEVNKQAIATLQADMINMKDDIKDIKVDTSRTADDVSAILSAIQSLMLGCDTTARDKFNDYLAHR
jgi:seryl-tRNA synthetase